MDVLIIGTTRQAMEQAVELARQGHHVRMITEGSYPGEDLIGTFRACAEAGIRQWMTDFCEGAECDTPAQMKRALFERLRRTGVSVRFYTRFVAALLGHGQVCGALVMGMNGLTSLHCDVLMDGTLLHSPSWQAIGKELRIPAGTQVTLRASVLLSSPEGSVPTLPDAEACADPADPLRVHWKASRTVPCEMTPSEAVQYVSEERTGLLARLKDMDGSCDTAQPTALELSLPTPSVPVPGFLEAGGAIPGSVEPVAGPDGILLWGRVLPYDEALGLTSEHLDALPNQKADVLVCGGGTAGLWATLACAREGVKTICLERFGAPGGTRTLGGVSGLYCGNRSGLFEAMWQKIRRFAGALPGNGSVSPVPETLFAHHALREAGVETHLQTSLCGVWTENRRISRVLAVGEDGLFILSASQYVDATGEGLLCHLAGCGESSGDDMLGMTQNYSQWNRCQTPRRAYRPIDQDVMDSTSDEEWQRCAENNLLRAGEYDLFELLTPREGRRIQGRSTLSLRSVARGERRPDTLYDAYSTFDPHGRSFGLEGRLGALPALGRGRFAAVSLGVLLPRDLDGVWIVGKAISCTQEGSNFVRMCPDVMSLGAIAGCLAARCAGSGTDAEALDLKPLQAELFAMGALVQPVPDTPCAGVNASQLCARLLAGEDETVLQEIILARPDGLDERLRSAADNATFSNRFLMDFVLLLYGDASGAGRMTERLKELDEKCGALSYQDRQRDTGVILGGVHGKADAYWRMNQLAVLLAHAQYRPAIPTLLSLLRHTVPGGEWGNATSVYSSIRLDTNTIPNYDRILCLAHAISEMPDACFLPEVARVFEETAAGTPPTAQVWRDYLLIRLAYACKRCGGDWKALTDRAGLDASYAMVRRGMAMLRQE